MKPRIILVVGLWLLGGLPNAIAGSVGRTLGAYSTSSTGAATYSIPIWAPPGPQGLQPNVSLVYNSRSGNGPMGVGWSLSGLSAISRCNATYAQDGSPGAVTLTSTDRFCLDGNKLRLTSAGSYGQSGTTYQTEIANFSNVTAEGTTGNGPSYFTIQGRDGRTYEYGNGGYSQVVLNGTANSWLLNKVTDRAGNTMTIAYEPPSTNLVGTTVPAKISWTPSTSGSTSYVDTMLFEYSNLTVPTKVGQVAGSAYSTSVELKNIEIEVSGSIVKNYVLAYSPSATTGREVLTTITECADSGATNCLAPTSVGYESAPAGVASPTSSAGSSTDSTTSLAVDVNGDGYQDLVYTTSGANNTSHYWVQFSNGNGFGNPVDTGITITSGSPLLIDNFLATAANQFLVPVGGVWYAYEWDSVSQSFKATSIGVSVVSGTPYAAGDIDGDGRPDIAYGYPSADGSTVYVAAQFNTSSSGTIAFGPSRVVGTLSNLVRLENVGAIFGDNAGLHSSITHLDFDGDGRSDFLIEVNANNVSQVVPMMSRGGGAAVFGTAFPYAYKNYLTIPVKWNDDPCTDLIFGDRNGETVWIAGCNGTQSQIVTIPGYVELALDWDGDGRTDVISVVGSTWEVFTSTGSGISAGANSGISPSGTSFYFCIPADINGDGLDDLIFAGQAGTITYGLHNGSNNQPDIATSFKDGYGNSVTPVYAAISQPEIAYNAWNDQAFPNENYIGPLYVAYRIIFSDPSTEHVNGFETQMLTSLESNWA